VALKRIPGQQTEILLAETMAATGDPDLLAQTMDRWPMICQPGGGAADDRLPRGYAPGRPDLLRAIGDPRPD